MPAQGDTSCLRVLQGVYASFVLAAAILAGQSAGAQAKTCWPYGTVIATAGVAVKKEHSQEVCPHQLAGEGARDRYPGQRLHELGSRREPRLQLPEETRHLALQRGGNTLPALSLRSAAIARNENRRAAGSGSGDLNASRFSACAPLLVLAARHAGDGAGLGTLLLVLGPGEGLARRGLDQGGILFAVLIVVVVVIVARAPLPLGLGSAGKYSKASLRSAPSPVTSTSRCRRARACRTAARRPAAS